MLNLVFELKDNNPSLEIFFMPMTHQKKRPSATQNTHFLFSCFINTKLSKIKMEFLHRKYNIQMQSYERRESENVVSNVNEAGHKVFI